MSQVGCLSCEQPSRTVDVDVIGACDIGRINGYSLRTNEICELGQLEHRIVSFLSTASRLESVVGTGKRGLRNACDVCCLRLPYP